jgi:RimJ/RimL family protein N-acetyltransferase
LISLETVEIDALEPFRLERLRGLPFFQDLYIEFLVTGELGPISAHLIRRGDAPVGYAVTDLGGRLLEFFHRPEGGDDALLVLDHIMAELDVKTILCQTFDAQLLNACLLRGFSPRVLGRLYRHRLAAPDYPLEPLEVRQADPGDLPLLNAQEDEVFEPKSRLQQEVESGGVWLFYSAGTLAGCGFITRIHEGFDVFDLGVWTHPSCRGQGVARRIIAQLDRVCREWHGLGICGCDVTNGASQRVLAANGFLSLHSLLAFTVTP